jgi:hypothetical protein
VSIQAAGDARIAQLPVPTLAAGESYDDLLADRSAFEDFDADAAGRRGPGRGAPHPTRRRAPARGALTCYGAGRPPGRRRPRCIRTHWMEA